MCNTIEYLYEIKDLTNIHVYKDPSTVNLIE